MSFHSGNSKKIGQKIFEFWSPLMIYVNSGECLRDVCEFWKCQKRCPGFAPDQQIPCQKPYMAKTKVLARLLLLPELAQDLQGANDMPDIPQNWYGFCYGEILCQKFFGMGIA